MDISDTLLAKSDQLNAADLSGGPFIGVIKGAWKGTKEQPLVIDLEGLEGRPWKPSLGMRRIIAFAWGHETDEWVGRSVKLVNNPAVTYAGEKVGGVEVIAMSHIKSAFSHRVRLDQSRGKQHRVEVLTPEPTKTPLPARDWTAEAEAIGGDLDKLRTLWKQAEAAGASAEALQAIQNTTKETTK